MIPCAGKCGREGRGPFNSGDPALDARYSWCDPCYLDLAAKRMPPGLVKDVPAGTYVPFQPSPPLAPRELSALRRAEHKIMPVAEVKSVAMVATAQALRQMVRNGAKLGLSIDYLTDASRPDGKGGRLLDQITVVGGAVTPKPMNPMAVITEGKAGDGASWAPVVDLYADAQRQAELVRTPDQIADDRLLAAAQWPPRGMFDRKTALSLIRGAALARAARQPDDAGDLARARWQQANEYSLDLAGWMAAHK